MVGSSSGLPEVSKISRNVTFPNCFGYLYVRTPEEEQQKSIVLKKLQRYPR